MTDTRNLRILYTINANPQYILARTLRPVEVSILPDAPAGPSSPQARYATAQLKPCLDAVCRSSPELLQDKSRDFSVYLLDPLESSFVATKQGVGFDRGVAVGLGLLSTAHEIADTPVTGTVVRLPTNQEAVEIILSFTETRASRRNPSPLPPPAPVPQTPAPAEPTPPPAPAKTHATRNSLTLTRAVSLPASSSAASTSAPPSKAPPNWSLVNPSKVKKKPPQKLKEPQTVSYTNEPYAHAPRADYILANTQTYIGPKTKKGRPTQPPSTGAQMWMVGPSGSTPSTTTSTTTSAASTPASAPGPSPAHAPSPLPAPSPSPAVAPSPAAAPSPAVAPSPVAAMSPPAIPTGENLSQEAKHNLLDVLALIMACSGDATQQAALLASLSTIDSSSPEQTAVVLEQIKAVLLRGRSVGPPPPSLPPSQSSHPPAQTSQPSFQTSQPDGMVVDKENCNPSPPKRTGKEAATTPSTSTAESRSGLQRSASGLQNSTSKSNAAPVVVPPAVPAPSEAGSSTVSRKRTFDQFAAGMSARVGRSKEQRRQSGSGENKVPATSPVRGPARQSDAFGRAYSSNDASSQRTASTSQQQASTSHRPPSASHRVVSASSPVRPLNKRPYTLPSWARTDTATQPRLSEEALRAQREADARRREVRLARKRERRVARQGVETEDDSYSESGGDFSSNGVSSNGGRSGKAGRGAKASTSANSKSKPMKPIAALPLFPSSSTFPLSSSADLPPPSTPPRRRAGSLPATPGELGGSLFTPSTPRGLRAPTTPVTPRRHRPSPIKTPRSKSVGADGADMPLDGGEGGWDDDDDFLSKELSESPSAGRSSDMRRFDSSDARRFNSGYVPPSSPLPPSSPPRSSPLDHPMELEMEDGDETILSPEPLVGTPNSAEGLGGTQDGFAGANEAGGLAGTAEGLEGSSDDAFDMLQLFSDSDAMLGSEGLNDAPGIDMSMFENGLADMDFTEFWQSMGPLLHDSGALQGGEGGLQGDGGGGQQEGAGQQNHQDLQHGTWDGTTFGTGQQAESVQDVHSLFSGCLL